MALAHAERPRHLERRGVLGADEIRAFTRDNGLQLLNLDGERHAIHVDHVAEAARAATPRFREPAAR